MRFFAILMLAQLAGCSREPAVVATPTLVDVSASVRSNMTAYSNLLAQAKVPMNRQAQMQAAKARFDIAYRLALEANMGDARFPAKGDVVKATDEIEALTHQP